jgi:hypothetical protein
MLSSTTNCKAPYPSVSMALAQGVATLRSQRHEMKEGRLGAFFLLPADYLPLGLDHER